MTTLTVTVRIVPCDSCNASGKVDADEAGTIAPASRVVVGNQRLCPRCDGRGQLVATNERLLVGLVLAWDRFR